MKPSSALKAHRRRLIDPKVAEHRGRIVMFAHYAKGSIRRSQGRCEEAIPEYETTLALNPNFGFAPSEGRLFRPTRWF